MLRGLHASRKHLSRNLFCVGNLPAVRFMFYTRNALARKMSVRESIIELYITTCLYTTHWRMTFRNKLWVSYTITGCPYQDDLWHGRQHPSPSCLHGLTGWTARTGTSLWWWFLLSSIDENSLFNVMCTGLQTNKQARPVNIWSSERHASTERVNSSAAAIMDAANLARMHVVNSSARPASSCTLYLLRSNT